MERPDFFELKNGSKAKLPFTDQEYQVRLNKIRQTMSKKKIDMVILTSMHNIAYYTGFIYCSFGRPYGCVITENKIVTISANIDASQPWRRSNCENIIYTDWKKDNFLRAIVSIIGRDDPPKNIGIETDHITPDMRDKVYKAAKDLDSVPYYHYSIGGKPFEEQLSIMRRWLAKEVGLNPDGTAKDCVIIYDYVKLMTSDSISSSLAEFQVLGFMMTGLHNFALRYKVPILAFIQLNSASIFPFNSC